MLKSNFDWAKCATPNSSITKLLQFIKLSYIFSAVVYRTHSDSSIHYSGSKLHPAHNSTCKHYRTNPLSSSQLTHHEVSVPSIKPRPYYSHQQPCLPAEANWYLQSRGSSPMQHCISKNTTANAGISGQNKAKYYYQVRLCSN